MDDVRNMLLAAARDVQGNYALPTAGFEAGGVGAALLTDKGNVYTGICIDVACGIGFCAEHGAIADMLKHRETRIVAVVAVGDRDVMAPCGRCREFMMQVDARNGDADVYLPGDQVAKLRDLLPFYWN